MPKTYTVPQLAKMSKRNSSSINRLIRQGKFDNHTPTKAGRTITLVFENKEAAVAAIHTHMPRGGYTWKSTQVKKDKKRSESFIHLVKAWLDIPEAKRAKLLAIAERFDADELDIILEL